MTECYSIINTIAPSIDATDSHFQFTEVQLLKIEKYKPMSNKP